MGSITSIVAAAPATPSASGAELRLSDQYQRIKHAVFELTLEQLDERGGTTERGASFELTRAGREETIDPVDERETRGDLRRLALRDATRVLLRGGDEKLFARGKMLANRAERHLRAGRHGLRGRRELAFVGEVEQRAHDRDVGARGPGVTTVDLRRRRSALGDAIVRGALSQGLQGGRMLNAPHEGGVPPARIACPHAIA